MFVTRRCARPPFALLFSALLIGTGCGRGTGGVAVSGKVTLDDQPLASGTISLVPEGPGVATAATISAGAYSIPAREGPTAGTYRVEVHSIQSSGRAAKKIVDPDYAGDETIDVVPAKYNRDTTLRAEVKAQGPNTFDFDLKSKEETKKGRP